MCAQGTSNARHVATLAGLKPHKRGIATAGENRRVASPLQSIESFPEPNPACPSRMPQAQNVARWHGARVTGEPLGVRDAGGMVTLGLHGGSPQAHVHAQDDPASRVELVPFLPSSS